VGSGAGIKQVTEGTVDFGGDRRSAERRPDQGISGKAQRHWDPAFSNSAGWQPCRHTTVEGVTTPLNFTPDAIAGIFLGKVDEVE